MRRGELLLRANAVFDAGMGVLLLAAAWDGLYDALGLPFARPALYAQLAGGLLLGYAYLLWTAPGSVWELPVGRATAAVNALGVIVLGGWLAWGDLGAGTLGVVILWLTVAVLAVFAAGEAAVVRERG